MAEKIEETNSVREDRATSETTLEATPEKQSVEAEKSLQDVAPGGDGENEDNDNSPPKENTVTKTVSSQSQKMTKSKTIIIMGALCVCIYLPGAP